MYIMANKYRIKEQLTEDGFSKFHPQVRLYYFGFIPVWSDISRCYYFTSAFAKAYIREHRNRHFPKYRYHEGI